MALSILSGAAPAGKANRPVRRLAGSKIREMKLSCGDDTSAYLCGAVTLVGETEGKPTVDMATSGEWVYGFIVGLARKDFSWSDYKYGQWIPDGTVVDVLIPKDGAEFLVVAGDDDDADSSNADVTYGKGLELSTNSADGAGMFQTQTSAEAGDRLVAKEGLSISDGDCGYIWARMAAGLV